MAGKGIKKLFQQVIGRALYIMLLSSAFLLTYLSRLQRDGIGTFPHTAVLRHGTGCQGFIGPVPQPFLISEYH